MHHKRRMTPPMAGWAQKVFGVDEWQLVRMWNHSLNTVYLYKWHKQWMPKKLTLPRRATVTGYRLRGTRAPYKPSLGAGSTGIESYFVVSITAG